MPLRKETSRIQNDLGAYCRTGVEREIPGVTPGRIRHYRRLVNNVVRDILDSAYPITYAALGEEVWDDLVQDFFAGGEPQSPQVWKMPYEFYQYHASRDTAVRIGVPYLEDLLYFEWMEIEVYNMPDRPVPDYSEKGHPLRDAIVLNPEYEIFRLEYPVHMHSATDSTDRKGEYYVLVYRLPETGQVRFLNLSPIYAYILTRIAEEGLSLASMRGEIARASGIESGTYLDTALKQFATDFREKQVVLGFAPKN